MLKVLSYILLYLLGGTFGLVSGLLYTIISGTAKDQGLAAGGILVFNALVGLLLGIIIATLVTVKVENKQIPKTNKIMTITNVALILILTLLIKSNT